MKLKEIKNIKPKQIYKHKDGNIYIVSYQTHYRYEIADCYKNNMLDSEENEFYSREFAEDMELIGFVNITHKLENNKLVEIPREEFEVDDVVELLSDTQTELGEEYKAGIQGIIKSISKDGNYISLADYDFGCYEDYFYIKNDKNEIDFKKIGIYGITHEFVNDKLIKE